MSSSLLGATTTPRRRRSGAAQTNREPQSVAHVALSAPAPLELANARTPSGATYHYNAAANHPADYAGERGGVHEEAAKGPTRSDRARPTWVAESSIYFAVSSTYFLLTPLLRLDEGARRVKPLTPGSQNRTFASRRPRDVVAAHEAPASPGRFPHPRPLRRWTGVEFLLPLEVLRPAAAVDSRPSTREVRADPEEGRAGT